MGAYTAVDLLGEYPEEIEASLCATYSPRNPIQEFWRGEISLRHLRVLIEGLPPDSYLSRVARGSQWGDLEWILHSVDSQMRVLNASVHNALSDKADVIKNVEFLPTPFDDKSVADEAEEKFLAQQRADMDAVADRMFANN
jgi:hypothetical protein